MRFTSTIPVSKPEFQYFPWVILCEHSALISSKSFRSIDINLLHKLYKSNKCIQINKKKSRNSHMLNRPNDLYHFHGKHTSHLLN